jgi:hypothetical protein
VRSSRSSEEVTSCVCVQGLLPSSCGSCLDRYEGHYRSECIDGFRNVRTPSNRGTAGRCWPAQEFGFVLCQQITIARHLESTAVVSAVKPTLCLNRTRRMLPVHIAYTSSYTRIEGISIHTYRRNIHTHVSKEYPCCYTSPYKQDVRLLLSHHLDCCCLVFLALCPYLGSPAGRGTQ